MRKRLIWGAVLVVLGIGLCFVPVGAYCVDGADFGYCDVVRLIWLGVPVIIVGLILIVAAVIRRSDGWLAGFAVSSPTGSHVELSTGIAGDRGFPMCRCRRSRGQ